MSTERALRLSDFDYELPAELIAQHPLARRSASRLLHVDGGRLDDLMFADLPRLLAAGDVLVVNDTRVVNARLRGVKSTGGRVELLIERLLSAGEAIAQCRASHVPRSGSTIRVEEAFDVEVVGRDGRFVTLRVLDERPLSLLLARHGRVPLPPYIDRQSDEADAERYQTVYAREPGAVAAPTAGLHFDAPLLAALGEAGVVVATLTLHVGAGTFLPVVDEDLSRHRMHREWFSIPEATAAQLADAKRARRSIVAVGTTTLRALEAAARDDGSVAAGEAETDLFIVPGYRFHVVDRLVTNFHLPRSTLLMLVSAFAGRQEIRRAYAHAIERRYRFFSYGDAMLLERGNR